MILSKKYLIPGVFAIMMLSAGCDSVYQYVMFPPQRVEYTLVANSQSQLTVKDSVGSYNINTERSLITYDRKDFKIEIKYLTDYHLNTFEFPDQSVSGQYSTNPFTYGNWVDPALGYVPNRFTVFKVSIYNHAGSKINFDPENAFLYTDRGDELYSYGREEKNSKHLSLELYYKKRKGTSGVDDDVLESRMGIIRRTVHYLGKPVFRGDVRDGLIVFDPLADDVEQVKIVFKDFILGYDENNQPSEFATYSFYFDRMLFESPAVSNGNIAGRDSLLFRNQIKKIDPTSRPSGDLRIVVRTTNAAPISDLMKPLDTYFSENTNYKTSYQKTELLPSELQKANILFIFAEEGQMRFTQDQEKYVADFVKNGGFIVADERSLTRQSENWSSMNNFLTNVSALLGDNVSSGRVPTDHYIYSIWKKFDNLPAVDATLLDVEGREENEFLSGHYIGNRLIAVISNRGYSVAWGEFGTKEARDGKDFTSQRDFLSNILYYGIQSSKHANNQ